MQNKKSNSLHEENNFIFHVCPKFQRSWWTQLLSNEDVKYMWRRHSFDWKGAALPPLQPKSLTSTLFTPFIFNFYIFWARGVYSLQNTFIWFDASTWTLIHSIPSYNLFQFLGEKDSSLRAANYKIQTFIEMGENVAEPKRELEQFLTTYP